MEFLCSLMTDEMAFYVLGNFEWYRREVAFPPLPLPYDYEELCLDFVLAEAEEYARDYEFPSHPMWASLPPRPLLKDYRDLCLNFTLSDAGQVACDFGIPEIVQATFYTMLLNDAVELSMLSVNKRALLEAQHHQWVLPKEAFGPRAARRGVQPGAGPWGMEPKIDRPANRTIGSRAADYVRATFMWHLRELVRPPQPLPEDYSDPCPDFNLEVAKASARDSHIPELTQAVFCTVVLNGAVALGVSCVIMDDTLTPILEWLNWDGGKGGSSLESAQPEAHPSGLIPAWWAAKKKARGPLMPIPLLVMRSSCVYMSSSYSSSGNVPERLAGPQIGGRHPQFPSLLALIDGREIDVAVDRMLDFQECRMAKTKTTTWLRSLDELLAKGTSKGNPHSSSGSHKSSIEVEAKSTSPSSSSEGETSSSGTVMLKKRGRTREEPVQEVVADGMVHLVQSAPNETGDLGWYCFNNKKGFLMAIEKKTKVKNWKYDFLFIRCETGWGDLPDWNKGKPVRNPYGEPTDAEKRTA
ncbi:hypothetical protein Cgig2_025508 [Carnegiea gigantea]|uniref:Uncharacterized protein n=1 Tax=Carnegiea gigantea TaxID=171969 RepID=A0A9Q1GFU2_9CARY|nr:hypothetical protein Cgig2_025508 [Carnegiea gigantea]